MANNKMDSAGLAALISNIKRLFSTKGHKHTISDLVNYKVDSELISGSTNPVQNTAIVSALNNKAASSHTHTMTDVTDLQDSLDAKANSSHTHAADDITSVNASVITGTISENNLPSYVDDVLEYDSKDNFPETGESGKIYIDTSTNLTYRWGGTAYVSISSSLALGETSSTAYAGDKGAAAYKHAVTNKGAAFSNGLYKITTNSEGHVTEATSVTKSDITALGIPAQDTTYSVGNGTITVTQNGTTKGTFTVNQSGNTTIALTDTNTDTNTHYTSKNVVGSSTATSNTTTALTNGNVYLNSVENGAVTSTHNIKGSGAASVTTDAKGNIIITSINTTYTSLKNPNGLTISLNGTSQGSYDGSSVKQINITPSSIGLGNVDNTADEDKSVQKAIYSDKLGSDTIGSGTKLFYLSSGVPTSSTETVGSSKKPIYLDSGAITASSSTVGSVTKPVYMNAGTITQCNYSIASSVPANAVFTDTTYDAITTTWLDDNLN